MMNRSIDQSKTFSFVTPIEVPQPNEYLEYVQARKAATEAEAVVHKHGFLFADEKMMRIREIISQISPTNMPVLISGEAGVGKEVVAKAIHDESPRAGQAFVIISCSGMTQDQMDHEMFGYDQDGHRVPGKIESADGGTILIDSVHEMNPMIQAKLLRLINNKTFDGINHTLNVRLIATTSQDLIKQVASGNFRQDLYYKLNVIHIEVPSLKERPKDIEFLAKSFLESSRQNLGRGAMAFTAAAMDKLRRHTWSGNVRELESVVHRAVVVCKKTLVDAVDIPLNVASAQSSVDWVGSLPIGRTLRDVETQFILETLKNHQGNRTHAAKTLGISLRTLRNKINEFTAEGIDVIAPLTGKSV